jgi:2-polyprenyl-6-methoxyphenol hydroxylase-like FAD-dependent oxidoreductase
MSGKAVIVGSGVGGLATAVGLRRAGWEVTVIERRDELDGFGGAAFGINPPAQKALDRLGLGEAFLRRAVPYRQAAIREPGGRTLARLPLDRVERRGGRPERLIARPHLLRILLDALDGIEIRYGERVGDPAALTGYDLVVGADGIGSGVRAAYFGGRTAQREVGTIAWIGVADTDVDVHGETWGDGAFFGYTPVEPGRTNWYAVLPSPADAAAVRPYFATWHDPIPRLLAATDPATWIGYRMRHLHPALPTYVRGGRVALIGDAAHAMTPNLGQGACSAILDAEALSRAVAAHTDLPAALRAYDAERRRPSQRVAFASRSLHRFITTRHPRLRDGVLRMLPA